MATTTAATATEIQTLYVAYFNRPADPLGLQAWQNTGASVATIAAGFSASDEFKATYAGKTPLDLVNSIYMNLFGRPAESAGLLFWAGRLQAGQETFNSLVLTIANAAQNDDLIAINNKVTAATAFTASLDTPADLLGYDGAAANAVVKAWLAGVTTNASLTAATTAAALQATADAASKAHIDSTNQPTNFNLTNGVDTLVGTNGNDVFTAGPTIVIDNSTGLTKVVDSLQGVDTINGGTGNDSLAVTVGNVDTNVAPTLTNVENVTATFTAAGKINLSNATGLTSVAVKGSTVASVVDGVGAVANLSVSNIAAAASTVTFNGSTAKTLGLTVDNLGTTSQAVVTATAAAATTLNVTANASDVEVKGTTLATAATIAATGANTIKLTDGAAIATLAVTGAGSVDVSSVNMVKVNTLTVADGGITFNTGDSTAASFTATTGAGVDKLTVDGAVVKSIATGAGNDVVNVAVAALAAAATIDLGAGDDTINFSAAPAAGVTVTGGAGKDTIGMTSAALTAVAAADLAKVTGFEILSLTDGSISGANDLSKIAGLTGFQTAGVVAAGSASISGVGAGSDVILNGDLVTNNGTLTINLKDATGTTDALNLTINHAITQTNDGAVQTATPEVKVIAAGIETLNVTSTGTLSTTVATGDKADLAVNTLTLTDAALVNLKVSGDQAFSFTANAGMTKLASIDASANTAGATINAAADTIAVTIKGTAKADIITSGTQGDSLTGGAGNDTFAFGAGSSVIGTGKFDTITDFAANTYGNAVNASAVATGGAGTGAGADVTKFTGDILSFTKAGTGAGGVVVDVLTSAADASTYLANNKGANVVVAALDSANSNLYVDNTGDGVADFYIHLTGVTTITAAAFTLV